MGNAVLTVRRDWYHAKSEMRIFLSLFVLRDRYSCHWLAALKFVTCVCVCMKYYLIETIRTSRLSAMLHEWIPRKRFAKRSYVLFKIYGSTQNIYVAGDGKKMEFKWQVNANVARLHSSYRDKTRLSETFFVSFASRL